MIRSKSDIMNIIMVLLEVKVFQPGYIHVSYMVPVIMESRWAWLPYLCLVKQSSATNTLSSHVDNSCAKREQSGNFHSTDWPGKHSQADTLKYQSINYNLGADIGF